MNRLAFAFACLLVTLLIIGHQRSAPVEIPWPAPPPAIPAPVEPAGWMTPVVVRTVPVPGAPPSAPVTLLPWLAGR